MTFRKLSTCIFNSVIGMALMPATFTPAQVNTANVTGIVEDSAEARIPDASVKLINNLTGTENNSTTNQIGIFLLPSVIPGSYTLQIERDGFATVQFRGLVLNVGDTKNFVIRMQVGSVAQTVSIDASTVAPNSTDATVSTVVDQRFVANTPLNGRSFQDLISMTPGVTSQSPQAIGVGYSAQGDFSVNGQPPDTNSYTIDGVSADIGAGLLRGHTKFASSGSAAGTTALGTTQSLVSIDDLQEFRVLTSNYSAEYGRTSGGQFTLLTRSGTNSFHGSLYDYVRNNVSDAADWFARVYSDTPDWHVHSMPYQQHDFGGALGGPIRHPGVRGAGGETFFFASYEGLKVTEPAAPLVQYIPTCQVFKASPAPIPLILGFFCANSTSADSPPASTGMGIFIPHLISDPGSINSTSIRIDHAFSSKISAFVRSSFTPSKSESTVLTSTATHHVNTQTDTLGASLQLSANSTNEFRFGYGVSNTALCNSNRTSCSFQDFYSTLRVNLGIPAGSLPSSAADLYIHFAGAGDSELNNDEASGSVRQWDLRDTFASQRNHHLLQFGIDHRYLVSAIHPPALSVEADFFNLQSVLTNSASAISITKSLSASSTFNQFAAFIQDEWQASKSLTISSGLRWEVDPAPHGKNGADAFTAIGNLASPASLTLASRGTPLWDTSWFNIAPRIGAAWRFDRGTGHELVVRAGGGVFFDTDNRAAVRAFSALGFSQTMHSTNVPLPVTASQLDFSLSSAPPYTHSLVFAFPRHFQLPYSVQWNVAIEQSLGKYQTLTASYVGASGRRLLREQRTDINQQNPHFGEIEWFPAGATSNYQALQLKFQRTMAHGVQALASYGWSHTLDYGSLDPVWGLTRVDSNTDLRHNFEAALSWDERKLSDNWLHALFLGGWGADLRLTSRSAFPVSPLGNIYSDPATGNRYFSGVDFIPNRPLYIYGSQYPGGRMLNGGPYAANPAFVLPAAGVAGNARRNISRGFGENQVNVAVRREIHLYDSFSLQIRAEAYNLFNHPELGYIDSSLTNALFGQATLMLNQSFGPTGSLYAPGGPRALQLSFRVHF